MPPPELQSVGVLPATELPQIPGGARAVSELERWLRSLSLAQVALWLLLFGCFVSGFALDRYPSHYIDESFFAFAPAKAAGGGAFTYAASASEPYGNQIWALHGPLMPHIVYWLFRLFGFSLLAARLPDFLGAWLAVLLMTLFLNARGYRYAGLLLAILWCGDRTWQEVMYARMDGVALLALVVGFLCLQRTRTDTRFALLAGAALGCACLAQPFCLSFAALGLFWTLLFARGRGGLLFLIGNLLNVPVLLWLWDFKPREAITQFEWHAHRFQQGSVLGSIRILYHVLQWSRYWAAALVLFALGLAIFLLARLARERRLPEGWWLDLTLTTTFAFVGIVSLFHKGTKPYYLVYFSLWAMVAVAILVEKRGRQLRPILLVLALAWTSSAAWNLMRIRESVLYHRALSRSFADSLLHANVPSSATIIATPEVWAFPIEDGYKHYNLTAWWEEGPTDVCPSCFLLLTASDFAGANYVTRPNLDSRKVLYSGPAFPHAGPLSFPIVLLSPETQVSTDAASLAQTRYPARRN